MAETSNTSCKCSLNVCIFQSKFFCFVVIFIVHIVNCVQNIYVNISKPFKHCLVFANNHRIVRSINYIICNRRIFRTNLHTLFQTFIASAVESVKQCFCKVSTSTKELHFFSSLSCRYTTTN